MHPEFEEADFATWSSQNLQEAAAFPRLLTHFDATKHQNSTSTTNFVIFVIFLRFLEQKYFQYCKFVKNCSN